MKDNTLMDNQLAGVKTIKVLFMASEAEPFVKVGGLGDVAGSLPKALREINVYNGQNISLDVRLVLPYHGAIKHKPIDPELIASFEIDYNNKCLPVNIYYTDYSGIPVYLVDGEKIPADAPVYSGDNPIDTDKYGFFSMAALLMTRLINWEPDIIHSNDWHTALTPSFIKHLQHNLHINPKPRSLLTIHNLPFFGSPADHLFNDYGLPFSPDLHQPIWAQRLPLPIGITAADKINAVSDTYAQEIMTPEFGCGLNDYLLTIKDKISGILNGIDYSQWNPNIDQLITSQYTPDTITNKQHNKAALLDQLGFKPSNIDIPLLGIIGRLDYQKGIDIAIEGLKSITHLPWNLVILGTGSQQLETEIIKFTSEFPDRIKSVLRFDVPLSHHIYAGADLLLMPSRYEPCGLAQMIAMKYGTLPFARAAGGLKDTITSHTPTTSGNGFLFTNATSSSFAEALQHALNVYDNKQVWVNMQINAMSEDFSWKQSALQYTELYLDLMGD